MSNTLLVRKIEEIPPKERRDTANHLRALHPVVIDEAIARLRERVEKGGEIGAWEMHDHRIGFGFQEAEICTSHCLQIEAVDVADPRLPKEEA